ncbi:MAG: 2Fe-2S iron-sulfur cluster-binding protein [Xanthobacteraceae bacterium]
MRLLHARLCHAGAAHAGHESHPNHDEIKRGIEGNLCRCTGYKKIIEAIVEAGLASDKENRP